MTSLLNLPIAEVLPEIVTILGSRSAVVIEAPPGAGKSTRVPPALLDAGLAADGQILVLEPRRVAARSIARRIASERNVSLGAEVGYQVRFDNRTGPQTRLAVITEGILTRRLQSDPLLDGVSVVILDEFHERSIHTDLALAFLKEIMTVRDDLKVVVMSATLEADPVATYLGCPVVRSEGRTYPIEIDYLAAPIEDRLEVEISRAVRRVVEGTDDDGGDVLVFLPGAGEIHRAQSAISSWAGELDIEVLPLYSALPPEAQDKALDMGRRRKVILSTNIAETSLTIEGVTTVIDSGLVRQMVFSPSSGLDNLELGHVSLASARQRAGRAGRVRPGRALRMWTRAYEHRMADYDVPEIQRVDITAPLLEVIAWSGNDPAAFEWFEAPSTAAIEIGLSLLEHLGALEEGDFRVSEMGRKMLDMPVHPRQGRMLLEAVTRDCVRTVAGAAALLSERDFVLNVASDAPSASSDLLARVELMDERRSSGRAAGFEVHHGRMHRVVEVRNQLLRVLPGQANVGSEEAALKAIATGYPDRVCLRRPDDEQRYVMVGGEPVALARESVVRGAELIVAPVIAGKTRNRDLIGGVAQRGLVRMASLVEEAWLEELYPGRTHSEVVVEFDADKERVMAFEREVFDGLCLRERVGSVDRLAGPAEVACLLAKHAAQDIDKAFGLSKDDRRFLNRLDFLREAFSELDVPDFFEVEEQGVLMQICWGKRRFDDLRRMNLPDALMKYLDHEQRRRLEEDVPEHFQVPSGSRIKLDYEAGTAPVLAVRIQEIFGLATTPTIAAGRVPLVLH
ncbi:MAG: ATP-dependent helicase HrpB, partial [Bradymonadaceae bacterium]